MSSSFGITQSSRKEPLYGETEEWYQYKCICGFVLENAKNIPTVKKDYMDVFRVCAHVCLDRNRKLANKKPLCKWLKCQIKLTCLGLRRWPRSRFSRGYSRRLPSPTGLLLGKNKKNKNTLHIPMFLCRFHVGFAWNKYSRKRGFGSQNDGIVCEIKWAAVGHMTPLGHRHSWTK